MSVTDRLKNARKAGVPLAMITTQDPPAMLTQITDAFAHNGNTPPIVSWDPHAGLRPLNDPGIQMIARLTGQTGQTTGTEDPFAAPPAGKTIGSFLALALQFDERTIAIVQLAHRILDDASTIAGVINLRDPYKGTNRILVLFALGPDLPPELQRDVLTLDDPLPTEEEIAGVLTREVHAAQDARDVETPDDVTTTGAIAALAGLPRFSIEQSIALTIIENSRIDVDDLWQRKGSLIRQIKGLTLEGKAPHINQLGGLLQIKQFGRELFEGEEPPAICIRIDEIEKAIAGFGSDTSGVTTDQVGVLLSSMEDLGWPGAILLGVAGSGKSQYSKSIAGSYGRRTLTLDMGAAKSQWVGASEQQIRQVVKMIHAIAGSRAFFLASCNRLEIIPTELRRRFSYGIWFFDVPTAEERDTIWPIQLQRYGLPIDSPRPTDDGWTGAEIRNCCEIARRLRRPLTTAAEFVVPVSKSDPDAIARLRRSVDGHFLDASKPGTYVYNPMIAPPAQPAPTGRRYAE